MGLTFDKLSFRAQHAIKRLGVETLDDLCKKTEKDLLSLRGCGRKTLNEIKELVCSWGRCLGEKEGGENPGKGEVRTLKRKWFVLSEDTDSMHKVERVVQADDHVFVFV